MSQTSQNTGVWKRDAPPRLLRWAQTKQFRSKPKILLKQDLSIRSCPKIILSQFFLKDDPNTASHGRTFKWAKPIWSEPNIY